MQSCSVCLRAGRACYVLACGVQGADLRVCDLEHCHRQLLHLLQTVQQLQYPLFKKRQTAVRGEAVGERGEAVGENGGGAHFEAIIEEKQRASALGAPIWIESGAADDGRAGEGEDATLRDGRYSAAFLINPLKVAVDGGGRRLRQGGGHTMRGRPSPCGDNGGTDWWSCVGR